MLQTLFIPKLNLIIKDLPLITLITSQTIEQRQAIKETFNEIDFETVFNIESKLQVRFPNKSMGSRFLITKINKAIQNNCSLLIHTDSLEVMQVVLNHAKDYVIHYQIGEFTMKKITGNLAHRLLFERGLDIR
jgi:hypothetical protein